MKDLINFIRRNSTIFITLYTVLLIVTIVILSVKLKGKDSDKLPPEILILKQYREKITEIDKAEDRATIDSLLFELYGFRSN